MAEDSWIEPPSEEVEPGPFAEGVSSKKDLNKKPATPVTPNSAAPAKVPPAAAAGTNWGRVVHSGASVYQSADFDAPVLGTLKLGREYPISSRVFGAFYKIKVKDGVYGFIMDTDIKPLSSRQAESAKQRKQVGPKKNEIDQGRNAGSSLKKKKARPFELEKFRGAEWAMIQFREDTMGLKPTENLNFFGFKASGQNVLLEDSYIDANILFHYGAPAYYEQATGRSADGFILLLDFLFENESRQGPNTLAFYGLGPLFKYSKISTALKIGSKEEAYDMVDMTVGAVFNLGIAQRFESFVLRGEIQYYWEKMQYMGFAVSGQLPF